MEMVPTDPNAAPIPAGTVPPESTEVPFVAASGGGGFGDFGPRTPLGPLLDPGNYMVRLTVGGKTLMTSVDVLADAWLTPKYSY
jgi:hypothetical protein